MQDFTPTERVAIVTYKLWHGRPVTVREVAEAVELSHSGAAKLLQKLAKVLPLTVEERESVTDGAVWRINSDGEPPVHRISSSAPD